MYCYKYSVLLQRNYSASTRYHEAITKLMEQAGQGEPDSFDETKRLCETCLEECRLTVRDLRQHRADHMCGALNL